MIRGSVLKLVAGMFAVVVVMSACELPEDDEATVTPPPELTDEEREALAAGCRDGEMADCDALASQSARGTDDETFGATCGNRIAEPAGSCVDLFDLGGPTVVYSGSVTAVRVDAATAVTTVLDANEAWDRQEGQLEGQERSDLYAETERAFAQAVDELTMVQDRVDRLSPPSGVEGVQTDLEASAASVAASASAVLEGLRLPASAEDVPGTARREAIVDLEEAAASFFGAADAAIRASTEA